MNISDHLLEDGIHGMNPIKEGSKMQSLTLENIMLVYLILLFLMLQNSIALITT